MSMQTTVFVQSYPPLPFDRSAILRYAGARESTPELNALLDECLVEAEKAFVGKICYCQMPISFADGVTDLAFTKTTSKDLARNLAGCDRAVVFAATVGIGIDRLIAKYTSLSPAKALLLQAIGTERIESLCDRFNEEIREKAKAEACNTRPRFSPGYGDLPLSLQQDVFSLLGCSAKIGLSLNQSLLMSPTKSVTAIIGLIPDSTTRRTL